MITFDGVELKDVEAGFDDSLLVLNGTRQELNTGGTRLFPGEGTPGLAWKFTCHGTKADIAALEAVSDYRKADLVVNGVTYSDCMIYRWFKKSTTDPYRVNWTYGVEIHQDTSGAA